VEIPRTAESEGGELIEEVVGVNRVAKVVKGGRNFRFNAAVVVGDGRGRVGGGVGKAQEIAEAIRKASSRAKKSMKPIPRLGSTVPHTLWFGFGGARVLIKPAPPGTGIVAGNVVRAVMVCAGVKDVVSKCLGSTNPINVMQATIKALYAMRSPEEIRKMRGRPEVQALHERRSRSDGEEGKQPIGAEASAADGGGVDQG
jgi:small subunit ribosomal protein S5